MAFKYAVVLSAFVLAIVNATDKTERSFQEVRITDGSIGCSSFHRHENACYKGFARSEKYGWTSASEFGDPPQMIWIQFKEQFELSELTFRPTYDTNEAPTKYQILGSNDLICSQYSPWTVLLEDLSGAPTTSLYQTKRSVVSDDSNIGSYSCFAIRALANSGTTGYVSLTNIRIFKKVQ